MIGSGSYANIDGRNYLIRSSKKGIFICNQYNLLV